MVPGALEKVLHHTRVQGAATLSDTDLLQRFISGEDGAAFEALVRRHGPMVLRVCQRVLHHSQDSEDAFQATFIVLARKARSIVKLGSLASWLHGVAYRIALKARCRASRRHTHEGRFDEALDAGAVREGPTDTATWSDLRPMLDEELNRLPEKYRTPLVLCYLEGKTNDEAADLLGCSRGAIAGRMAQARDLLRQRLTRRGLALSSGGLSVLLTQNEAPAALPVALVARSVHGIAAGSADALSPAAQSLATATLRWPGRWKWAGAAVVSLTVVVAGMSLLRSGKTASGATFTGHKSMVTSVAFAPDGKAVASVAQEGGIKLWDPLTGRELGTVPVPAVELRFVQFTGDGQTLVIEVNGPTASDRYVLLWDIKAAKPISRLPVSRHYNHSCVLAADRKTLLRVADDPDSDRITVLVCEAATGKPLAARQGPSAPVNWVSVSPDGRTLAWGKRRALGLRLYDMETRQERLLRDGSSGYAMSLFSPDGKTLATLERDVPRAAGPDTVLTSETTVRLWDVATGKERTAVTHAAKGAGLISRLCFSPDGRTLLTAGKAAYQGEVRGLFRLWNASTGQPRETVLTSAAQLNGVTAADFSADGRRLALGEGGGSVAVYDLKK